LEALRAVTLVVAVMSAFLGQFSLVRLGGDWDAQLAQREQEVGAALERELSQVLDRGESARDSVVAALLSDATSEPQSLVDRVRRHTDVDALALLGSGGELIAWSGTHHGPLPGSADLEGPELFLGGSPVFRYLYFVGPVGASGRTVLVAELMMADLPPGLAETREGFAASFTRSQGVGTAILPPDRPVQGWVWD
jgi:hypothetical protein